MKPIFLSGSLLLLVACTPTRPTTPQDTQVRALLEQARQAQAETLAPIEYRFAEKKLGLWQQAMEERDRARAALLLEQAALDAHLALTKSRAARAVQQMNQVNDRVRKLEKQLDQLQGELQ